MLYYVIEGTMEYPDTMTKKDMNDIYDEYGDFVEDYEIDYFGFLRNDFRVCVSFEVNADSMMRFLGLLKKYNGKILEIRCDDNEPLDKLNVKPYYSELVEMYDQGRDAVIELLRTMIEDQYPNVEYMADTGILWIERE